MSHVCRQRYSLNRKTSRCCTATIYKQPDPSLARPRQWKLETLVQALPNCINTNSQRRRFLVGCVVGDLVLDITLGNAVPKGHRKVRFVMKKRGVRWVKCDSLCKTPILRLRCIDSVRKTRDPVPFLPVLLNFRPNLLDGAGKITPYRTSGGGHGFTMDMLPVAQPL